MKIFQKNLMQSEDVQALLGTGVYYDGSDNPAPIHDGAVVSVETLEDHSLYANMKDINVRKLKSAANASVFLAVVDYVGRSEGEINGVNYREGIKTAGLVAPAGAKVRYRILKKGDTFYLGSNNFDSAPNIGEFAIPTINNTTWTVTTTKPVDGLGIRIDYTKALTEGATDTDTLYFCTVVTE